MNRTATDDRTEAFARLLEELRDRPPGTSGEWLARLVAEIRPQRPRQPRGRPRALALVDRVVRGPTGVRSGPQCPSRRPAHVAHAPHPLCGVGRPDQPGFHERARPAPARAAAAARRRTPSTCATWSSRCSTTPRITVWMFAVPREDWAALLDAIDVDGDDFAPARRKCRHEALEAMRLDSVRLAALGTDTALLQYLPALARHESPFLAQMAEVRGFIEHQAEPSPSSPTTGTSRSCSASATSTWIRCAVAPARRASASTSSSCWRGSSRFSRGCASCAGCSCRRRRGVGRRGARPRGRVLPAPGAPGESPQQRTRPVPRHHGTARAARHGAGEPLGRALHHRVPRRVLRDVPRRGRRRADHRRDGAGQDPHAKLDLPPVWEAVAFSLNYGIGFVLIHVLHLTIATKQPAMTAATLAAALDGRDNREARLDVLADLAAEVSRTQWISIAGNVTICLLAAFAIAMTAGRFLGWDPVGAGQGRAPAARPASVAQPRAAARGDRRRLSFPERTHLGLLRQPVAVPPRARATAPREVVAQAARGRAARAALRLRRAQSRRAGGQLPVRLHAGLHADRGRAARPAARHPPRRLLERQFRLRLERARVRGAGVDRRGQLRGRAADRPGQPRRQLLARVEGRAALAWHHARADARTLGAGAAAVPEPAARLLLAARCGCTV